MNLFAQATQRAHRPSPFACDSCSENHEWLYLPAPAAATSAPAPTAAPASASAVKSKTLWAQI